MSQRCSVYCLFVPDEKDKEKYEMRMKKLNMREGHA